MYHRLVAIGTSLVALACVLLMACGGKVVAPAARETTPPTPIAGGTKPAPAATSTTIGLALTVTPADAEVLIDGVPYGKASGLDSTVELSPGLYTLTVEKAGYVSYRVEFSVGDKTEAFVVQLDPVK